MSAEATWTMRLVSRLIALAWCALLTVPLGGEAQTGRAPRIGVVAEESPGKSVCVDALKSGLGELGYVEGRTYVLEMRWAEGRMDAFPGLAADLVQRQVDLLISAAGPSAEAVKQATTSIPIVLASSLYPVELGIIASLARPGGNVTGVTHFTPELMAKRVQLLKEIVPAAARVAVIRLPGRIHDLSVKDRAVAARQLGLDLQVVEVRHVDDLSSAFSAAARGRVDAVVSTQAPFFLQNNAKMAQFALNSRAFRASRTPPKPVCSYSTDPPSPRDVNERHNTSIGS